jgi:hypothetical protein
MWEYNCKQRANLSLAKSMADSLLYLSVVDFTLQLPWHGAQLAVISIKTYAANHAAGVFIVQARALAAPPLLHLLLPPPRQLPRRLLRPLLAPPTAALLPWPP